MARTRTEAKKTAILTAAQKAFATRDFHEVLTDDIAADAGIGKATLYRYFGTKEDLYFAALVDAFEELHRVLEDALPRQSTPRGRLSLIAREVLRIFWNRRFFYMLRHQDARRFGAQDRMLQRHRERVIRSIQETLETGMAQGDFRPMNARTGAELFMGMVRAALFYRRDAAVPRELVEQIIALFLHGVAATEAR
jgi:AcrR family transcriptional regulator